MSKYDLISYDYAVCYFQTESNKNIQKQILDCSKEFVPKLDIADSEVKIGPRSVKIINNHFLIQYIVSPYFVIDTQCDEEKALEMVNKLVDKSLSILYERIPEINEGFLYYELRTKIKNDQPIQLLTNKDNWNKVFGGSNSYQVRRLEIWEPPAHKLRSGFFIIRDKEEILLNAIRSDYFHNKSYTNTLFSFNVHIKEQLDDFLSKIYPEC